MWAVGLVRDGRKEVLALKEGNKEGNVTRSTLAIDRIVPCKGEGGVYGKRTGNGRTVTSVS